jgi:hypothetical protein
MTADGKFVAKEAMSGRVTVGTPACWKPELNSGELGFLYKGKFRIDSYL